MVQCAPFWIIDFERENILCVLDHVSFIELLAIINLYFLFCSQKLDPNQFLQVHGRQCKIHLDPAVAAAAEAPATM